MTDGVTIRFGGDTSALEASISAAKTAMGGFTAGVSAIGAGVKGTGSAVAGLAAVMRDVALTIAAVTYVVKPAISALDDLGNSLTRAEGSAIVFGAGLAKMSLDNSLSGIAEAQAGIYKFATSFSTASAAGARFSVENTGIMASVSNGYSAIGGAIDAVVGRITLANRNIEIYNAGLIDSEKAAASAAMGIMNFGDAAASGDLGNSTETLRALTGELTKIPDISNESAASLQSMLLTIPNYTVDANKALVILLGQISKSGDEAVANGKRITAAFNDTDNGGATLGAMVAQAKTMQDIQAIATKLVGSFKDAGQAAQFLTTTMAAMQEANNKTNQSLIEQLQTMEKFGPLARLFEIGINGQIQAQDRVNASMNSTLATMQKMVDVQTKMAKANEKQATLTNNIDSANTVSSQINDTQDKIKSLSATTRKSDDDDAEISLEQRDLAIRTAVLEAANQTDQGLLGVLNVMKNRLAANYGDYGDNLGDVLKKKSAFSGIDDAQGNYDPTKANSVDPNSAQYKRVAGLYDKTFGDDASDDPTNGATHYANLKLASPSWATGMQNQSTIGDHTFGNPDGAPVQSSDQDTQRVEALQKANDEMAKLNAEKAGGTTIDATALAIAQKNASEAKDEVADAQNLVAAKQKAVDDSANGSPQTQMAAAKALAEAQISLNEKVAAASKSAAALEIQQIPANTRAHLDAENAQLTAQQAAYAKDSAAWNALELEKQQATKKFDDTEKADNASAEDAKFQVAKLKSEETIQTIREQAAVGQITQSQMTAQVKAALTEQASLSQAHYATLASIWGEGTVQHRKAVQEQTQDAEKQNQAQITATNKATTAMFESYRSEFEKIGSSVAGSLTAIIEKTGTWTQLMQNVAKQILSTFVNMGVKMIADWAARQAASIALTVTGETAKTAAATAGETARTAVGAAGGIAQAASALASIGKSIVASAGEAFAGVFGFLSPVLGPAAAGPAAAAEATVLGAKSAMGSFAVGSWSLPGDQVAQVHAGEMIVPAAATPWAQSLMSNAAGGGGGSSGGGGVTHNWNVTTMSPANFMSYIKANANDLAKVMGRTFAMNPSTRGNY